MKKYKQLSYEERVTIKICLWHKMSINEIAKILGRSASTISRELNRKETVYFQGKYLGTSTHKKVKEKWKETHNRPKLNNIWVRKYVIKCLKAGITPELIAGRLTEKSLVSMKLLTKNLTLNPIFASHIILGKKEQLKISKVLSEDSSQKN